MTMGSNNEIVFEGDSKAMADFIPEKPSNPFDINFKKIGEFMSGVKDGVDKKTSFHSNQNLLALNINSFMAGTADIWKKANERGIVQKKVFSLSIHKLS